MAACDSAEFVGGEPLNPSVVKGWSEKVQEYVLTLAREGLKTQELQKLFDGANYTVENKDGYKTVDALKNKLGNYFTKKQKAAWVRGLLLFPSSLRLIMVPVLCILFDCWIDFRDCIVLSSQWRRSKLIENKMFIFHCSFTFSVANCSSFDDYMYFRIGWNGQIGLINWIDDQILINYFNWLRVVS